GGARARSRSSRRRRVHAARGASALARGVAIRAVAARRAPMTPPPGYILIRPETIVGVQKAIEAALGSRGAECLAAGGRAGGALATAGLEGDAARRARRLLSAGREIGWGEFARERLSSLAR